MKKYLVPVFAFLIIGCNDSHNDKMNSLLKIKKQIETRLDSNKVRDTRFRDITGYDEIYDSISSDKRYPQPELVESIWYLKTEKEFLNKDLDRAKYSIDSLSKLK